MSSEIGSRIAKNSIFNISRTLLTVPVVLLLTPYIISNLGKQEFGIWALVGVISSYAQLSDFGITESLIKFMAEYKARDDSVKLNQLINTAFSVYLILGIICCVLFLLVLPFVTESILSIPPEFQVKANYLFRIAVVLFFINMVMGVFGSLIIGFQRMGYTNLIAMLSTLITAFGTVFFISQGYGLSGLVYNNVIVTGFTICANLVVAKRLFPQLFFNPFIYFNRDILRTIFGFSWKVQLTNLTQLMVYQLDRVLLSHYVGLEAVSYYEIANRIATQARGLIATIFSPMSPAASALHAVDYHHKIAGLYKRAFKYMSITAVPFMMLIIALAHPFIRIWMGPGYETSAITLQLLLAAYMLVLLTVPGACILSGINKPEVAMQSSILAGILNLVLCLILVEFVGYYGVVIGIFISIIISGSYFLLMLQKSISGLGYQLYWDALFRPFWVSASLAVVIVIWNGFLPIQGYVMLCSVSFVFLVLVGGIMLHGTYLDDFDRETIERLNPLRILKR